ncbi:hypothetical protein NA57DRAFT_68625 [Rhizodiscina lignyota]|uniref:Amine oxidase domain-containing protein n=1 Tax=Rhizodiscina lignyota TaxID=1504668 RepID=A0A9P4I3V0_9PEZI|nr:hypothetical protein NA57DRAFT_68625 [Rhizodiscina lignyota]
MATPQKNLVSVRNEWAKRVARNSANVVHNRWVDKFESERKQDNGSVPRFPSFFDGGLHKIGPNEPLELELPGRTSNDLSTVQVGIVGAGAAGLFTALIFDYLNQECTGQIHFDYEIIEAADSSRVGGRLYTYNFLEIVDLDKDIHTYYDFRIFDLFAKLGMNIKDLADAEIGDLVPYYMKKPATDGQGNIIYHPAPDNKKNPYAAEYWHYNDITQFGDLDNIIAKSSPTFDAFSFDENGQTGIRTNLLGNNPGGAFQTSVQDLRDKFINGDDDAWSYLMNYDEQSTRQYLISAPPSDDNSSDPPPLPGRPYSYDEVEWMETFNGGMDWYDQAHSENVFESLDFDYAYDPSKGPWPFYCVLGGAQELAKRMEKPLQGQKPQYAMKSTAISTYNTSSSPNDQGINLTVSNSQGSGDPTVETKQYNVLFNSTTLACLQQMDLSTAGVNYGTKQATRSLGYGPSAKVAIKFKTAWWIHSLQPPITSGGLGHSDLMIRTCVYPSYNIEDKSDTHAVLLCSYSWQQDAERMGAMISSLPDYDWKHPELDTDLHKARNADDARMGLIDQLLWDLARMHTTTGKEEDIKKFYENTIKCNYMDHYSHDWTHDPHTMGAFAFFRPQQFSTIWPRIIEPSGDLVIVGEAASPHHAWVVGALESAVHGVHSWLTGQGARLDNAKVAAQLLETAESGNPYVGLPDYMPQDLARHIGLLGAIQGEVHARKMAAKKEREEL